MRVFNKLTDKLGLSSRHDRTNPSVTDYVNNEKALKRALQQLPPGDTESSCSMSEPGAGAASSSPHDRDDYYDDDYYGDATQVGGGGDDASVVSAVDHSKRGGGGVVEWKLNVVDHDSTEPQTMEAEFKRLQVLQSYFILDSPAEDEFDRLTRLASLTFDAPIALVSLVDLGRQWFMSRVGVDATETARNISFCAHVVLNKYKMLIVTDATKDARFKNSPLVTGPPHIRFYAGAALVSPEGYKLGSFCVISPVPRPKGLTEREQKMLSEMSGIAVNAMVARRNRILKQQVDEELLDAARALGEASRHVSEIQKSLCPISGKDGGAWHVDLEDILVKEGAMNDLDVQAQMMAAKSRQIVQQHDELNNGNVNSTATTTTNGQSNGSSKHNSNNHWAEMDRLLNPMTDMVQLYENVNKVIETLPRKDTVTVEMAKSVPTTMMGEDLLLFRSCVNLVVNSVGRPDSGTTHLRIRAAGGGQYILFECEDGSNPVPLERGKPLFKQQGSLLHAVRSMVKSMDGTYGMHLAQLKQRSSSQQQHNNGASAATLAAAARGSGTPIAPPTPPAAVVGKSIFWFKIPVQYDGATFAPNNETKITVHKKSEPKQQRPKPTTSNNTATTKTSKSSGSKSLDQKKIITKDPFMEQVALQGCAGEYCC